MSKYLTLEEYLKSAEIALYKYAEISNPSEDAIAFVAEYMMRADAKYKSGIGSRNGFRMFYASFGVRTWLTKRKKRLKKAENEISLDYHLSETDKSLKNEDMIEDPKQNVFRDVVNNDTYDYINNSLEINDRQKDILLSHFFESESVKSIASRLGVTKQAVYDQIPKCSKRLGEEIQW